MGAILISRQVLRETRKECDPASPCADAGQGAAPASSPLSKRQFRVFAVDPSYGHCQPPVIQLSIPYNAARASDSEAGGLLCGPRFAVAWPRKKGDGGSGFEDDRSLVFDLDAPRILVEGGYPPSLSDSLFLAQSVFAIAVDLDGLFSRALGREVIFGIGAAGSGDRPLVLDPWASEGDQAWFDPEEVRINFGYFKARRDAKGYPPGSLVYSALTYDIVVHELAHAFLDSVRSNYAFPITAEVAAFHEAFADLIVVFQRLTRTELVQSALEEVRGEIDDLPLLRKLASGFAQTAGRGETLRDLAGDSSFIAADREPHALGLVLVQAVCRAFRVVAKARLRKLVTLVSAGSGILPHGELSPGLAAEMARLVRKTADMFLSMIIRSLDYCPALGITFFDFLTAVIAADAALVPEDPEDIRGAWMEAFRFHKIFDPAGNYFTTQALASRVLNGPGGGHCDLVIEALHFSQMQFSGDPGDPLMPREQYALAAKVAEGLEKAGWLARLDQFARDRGIVWSPQDSSSFELSSLRNYARPGPRGMTEYGTSIELRALGERDREMSGYAGACGVTLLFDSKGRLSAAVLKTGNRRAAMEFARSDVGKSLWNSDPQGRVTRNPRYLQSLCRA